MEPYENQMPHTLCPKCNNFVLTSNFLIHQARCKGNNIQSSTFRNSQISALRRRQSQRNNSQSQQIEQQRIPCPFCGYGQTLRQLDIHPNVCPHRQTECSICKMKFPLSLMQQHQLVCASRQRSLPNRQNNIGNRSNQQNQLDQRMQPSRQQNQRNQRPQQNRFQRSQYQRYRPNIRNQINQERNQQQISPTLFRILQQRRRREQEPAGNLLRMMMGLTNNYERQNMMIIDDDPFQRHLANRRRVVMLDPGALIALLAGRSRTTGHAGMTKQDISKFPITKYVNHGNSQKQEQQDMCAICYCNFQEGDNCMNLSCKHKFHPECISKWLEKNPTCPLCKKSFKRSQQSVPSNNEQLIEGRQNLPGNIFIFQRRNFG